MIDILMYFLRLGSYVDMDVETASGVHSRIKREPLHSIYQSGGVGCLEGRRRRRRKQIERAKMQSGRERGKAKRTPSI